jgi:hypothetical protein
LESVHGRNSLLRREEIAPVPIERGSLQQAGQ